MAEERKTLGSVYRVTADFLAQKGVSEQVTSKASLGTKALLAKPPFAFSWQSNQPLEEIEQILSELPGGGELCAELGCAAGVKLCGSIIAGVLRMAFALFGQTPAAIFQHLDRFYSMVTSGYTFRYEPGSEKQGVVWAEIGGGPVHHSLFDQIRGNLRSAFALCSVEGKVELAEVRRHDAQGALLKYGVSWV